MSDSRPHISIVTPVYGCGSCLPELVRRIDSALTPLTDEYEIILVNDASPDEAWQTITSLANGNKRILGINLSRNFGQHHAITAGLDHARGDWVVVMDCDLQDRPEDIPALHEAAQDHDMAIARRTIRKVGPLKKLGSWAFHQMIRFATGAPSDWSVGNFGIYRKTVIDAVRSMRERDRGFPMLVRWLGFDGVSVDITQDNRHDGTSSYTFGKLFMLAMSLLVSQSNRPLHLSIGFGFTVSALSLLAGLALVVRYIIWGIPVAGWTSVIVSIYLVGGLMFANLGILGLYIGKIYDETKGRPLYVVKERTRDHA